MRESITQLQNLMNPVKTGVNTLKVAANQQLSRINKCCVFLLLLLSHKTMCFAEQILRHRVMQDHQASFLARYQTTNNSRINGKFAELTTRGLEHRFALFCTDFQICDLR